MNYDLSFMIYKFDTIRHPPRTSPKTIKQS
jgi:hypothetical protein